MELSLIGQGMRTGYKSVVDVVRDQGQQVKVRGEWTRELRNVIISLDQPWDCLPVGVGRKIGVKLAALEFLQLVAGVQLPNSLARVAPFFNELLDGEVLHGGYGQRTREAMPLVVDLLRRDPSTRQAQVSLWDNFRDLHHPAAKDIPCTSSLQFFVREERLELDVTMRSQDCWLGVPYDYFVFGQLHLTVANILKRQTGVYAHHARSLHLYDRDRAASHELLERPNPLEHPLPYGLEGDSWPDVVERSLILLRGEKTGDTWYEENVAALQ